MATVENEADAPERSYATPNDATRVRDLLAQVGLGQRAAARELEIGEREMRGYCAGDKVPRAVMLALERLVDLHRRAGEVSGGDCQNRSPNGPGDTVDRLKAQLWKYGKHLTACRLDKDQASWCDCGWKEVRETLAPPRTGGNIPQ